MKRPGIIHWSRSASDFLCALARSSFGPEHFFPWVPQPSCDFTFREWFCCYPLRAGEPWHAVGFEQIFASKLNSESWSDYGTLCPRHILGPRGQEKWAVAKCLRRLLPILEWTLHSQRKKLSLVLGNKVGGSWAAWLCHSPGLLSGFKTFP